MVMVGGEEFSVSSSEFMPLLERLCIVWQCRESLPWFTRERHSDYCRLAIEVKGQSLSQLCLFFKKKLSYRKVHSNGHMEVSGYRFPVLYSLSSRLTLTSNTIFPTCPSSGWWRWTPAGGNSSSTPSGTPSRRF